MLLVRTDNLKQMTTRFIDVLTSPSPRSVAVYMDIFNSSPVLC